MLNFLNISSNKFKIKKLSLIVLSDFYKNPKKFEYKIKIWKNFVYQKFQLEKNLLRSEKNTSENYFFEKLTDDGGVKKKILKKGSGPLVSDQTIVKVHYQGKIESGAIFDSSYDKNEPYIFKIGEGKVIRGWEIGIKTMRIGEKAILEIFPNYGYKKKGIPPIIPPNAKLFYEVELLDIVEKYENDHILPTNIHITTSNEIKSYDAVKNTKKKKLESFFFISPFRSQTGQEAPWWLNPNITFLFVFVIVFSLFWVVWSIGGIHQGYAEKSFDANLFL